MNTSRAKVGIIGCGNISNIYCAANTKFHNLEIVAVADVRPEAAKAKAEEHKIARALTPEELVAQDDIDIVVNLTIPAAHAQVSLAAIEAGKSVYSEKPLAVNRADGEKVFARAKAKNVLVGCAPDTVLGAGIQTCRKLIDDGWIGRPVAATAFMLSRGPESWHPNPSFFYEHGAGPLFDMGPYYVTTLINLLGPVKRVTASTAISYPTRIATCKEQFGLEIKPVTPTHVAGVLEFQNGAIATLIMSFDVTAHHLPNIEIYGAEGTLRVPDPNTFGGPVLIRRQGAKDWSEAPLSHIYAENSRGLGVADMAAGLRLGRPHRANGDVALHVLDVFHCLYESSAQGKHITPTSTCLRPEAFPVGLLPGNVDLV